MVLNRGILSLLYVIRTFFTPDVQSLEKGSCKHEPKLQGRVQVGKCYGTVYKDHFDIGAMLG